MRILAVDHDPTVHETLVQLLLQNSHFDAVAALSADAAITLLSDPSQTQFDCILIAQEMAASHNAKLIAEIRSHQIYRDVAILILTDTPYRAGDDDAPAPIRTACINKPFEIEPLRRRLEQLCAAPAVTPQAAAVGHQPDRLDAPLAVVDVSGFTDLETLKSDTRHLPRRTLYASRAFGLAIRDIELLHAALSPLDFHCMINDVADVIADILTPYNVLMAYAGNGVFVGITQSPWGATAARVMADANRNLAHADLCDSDSNPLDIRLSAGQAVKLTWKTAGAIEDALTQACARAKSAEAEHGRLREDFWFLDRSA